MPFESFTTSSTPNFFNSSKKIPFVSAIPAIQNMAAVSVFSKNTPMSQPIARQVQLERYTCSIALMNGADLFYSADASFRAMMTIPSADMISNYSLYYQTTPYNIMISWKLGQQSEIVLKDVVFKPSGSQNITVLGIFPAAVTCDVVIFHHLQGFYWLE